MTRRRPRALSIGVFLAVTGLSVGALVVSRVVIDNEADRLLVEQAAVVSGELSNALTATDTGLRSLGTLVSLPGGEASFTAAASPLLVGNVRTVALLRQQTGTPVPEVVVGDPLPTQGPVVQQLSTFVTRALRTPDMVSFVEREGYRRRLVLALALPPDVGPLVVYESSAVDLTNPFEQAAIATPADLHVAFYASKRADPDSLIESTGAAAGGSSDKAQVAVGADSWTLVVSSPHPLTGSFAQATPWLLLAGGLVSAVLAAAAVEVVLRRRDFAVALVDERTADLRETVAEMRRAQEAAKEASDALVSSERMAAIGRMASVVSHELRNPLSSIINSIFVARMNTAPEATERALDLAEREAIKATAIAEDIVAYARPRAPEVTEVVFGSVLSEVLEVLPPPPSVDVETFGREVVVRADRLHLVEVVSNLVSNAYDAMPDGGQLRVGAEESSLNGDSPPGTVVTVGDSGPGIPDDMVEQIFEPFVTTKAKGTGLGLAIVQRIAAVHGGKAWVETSPGGGTSVSVLFPQLARASILIVDDDEAVRSTASEILTGAGYHVVEACDGLSALSLLQEQHVDAMLLDLAMPRVNGMEVLHALRDSPLPIIVVTAGAGSELPQVVAERATAVFSKPVPPDRILGAVASVVSHPTN